MGYLLDSNVFIDAKNRHYGFDFCPAFWSWLLHANRGKKVFSIDKVREELIDKADDLSTWAAERGAEFFLAPDLLVPSALGRVSKWAAGQRYEPAAVTTFLSSGADYYLVAHALAHGLTVVTHEVGSTSKKKLKIPDACKGLQVSCIQPYAMLQHERARFVLAPTPKRQNKSP